MTRYFPFERPNCAEILEGKNLWALSENELKYKNDSKSNLEPARIDKNSYIYSIFESKLGCESANGTDVNDKSKKVRKILRGDNIENILIREIIAFFAHDVTDTFILEMIRLLLERLIRINHKKLVISMITLVVFPFWDIMLHKFFSKYTSF
jgi:hypothetical protein